MDNLPAIDKLYEEIISGNAKKIKKIAEKPKKKRFPNLVKRKQHKHHLRRKNLVLKKCQK
jgi:hypothetical protein